jgi:hypothetical protein
LRDQQAEKVANVGDLDRAVTGVRSRPPGVLSVGSMIRTPRRVDGDSRDSRPRSSAAEV